MTKIVNRTRKQVVKRWIKALRSGKYAQTTKKLRDNQGFCCLGVLCDLASKDGGNQWVDQGGRYVYGTRIGALPDNIQNFIFTDDYTLKSIDLIDLNDEKQYTFAEIANVIEKELL